MVADETYIKVRGIKGFIWFIMDSSSRSILGYQVSDNRSVGPCSLAMRLAFRHFKKMVERLNRTFKSSYRVSCGYDNYEGANYNVALWVACYNFLRPHRHSNYQALNKVELLEGSDNMPGKWQLLILLGQQTIRNLQNQQTKGAICS